MKKSQKRLNFVLDAELHEQFKHKCKGKYNLTMSALLKVFIKSFVTQDGVSFVVGEPNLRQKFNRWLLKREVQKGPNSRGTFLNTRLKDLYDL